MGSGTQEEACSRIQDGINYVRSHWEGQMFPTLESLVSAK